MVGGDPPPLLRQRASPKSFLLPIRAVRLSIYIAQGLHLPMLDQPQSRLLEREGTCRRSLHPAHGQAEPLDLPGQLFR